jgi:hypothetical protein
VATTTKIVSNYSDISGNPETNAVVVATLIGPTSYSGGTVDRQLMTRVGSDGNWSLNLFPNTLFSGDSYYIIRLGNKEQYKITVPNSVSPIPVTSILLTEAPCLNYSGNIFLEGDFIVRGDITVSGVLKAGAMTSVPLAIAETNPTIWSDINVAGNLTVTGTIQHSGSTTAGATFITGL